MSLEYEPFEPQFEETIKGCGRDDLGSEFRPCEDCSLKCNSKECLDIMKEEKFIFINKIVGVYYEEDKEAKK